MRRREKEITDRAAIDAILHAAPVCRLALADGDEPYLVPVCFGYDGASLFVHSAREGEKIDILRRNDRVCFQCDVETRIVPGKKACDWSMTYRSVIGRGRARFVEDGAAKVRALDVIMDHYAPGPFEYGRGALEKTLVIKIAIESLTGKQSGG